jgi:glycerol-3-phosphate acyltransferase PlsY
MSHWIFIWIFGFIPTRQRSYTPLVPTVGYILTALVAYLLGSVPTGFLVGKARGIDIRAVGSGNIGATNVFRALGTVAGVLVMLADALKGWLAVMVLARLFAHWFLASASAPQQEGLAILAGFCAILGHNYTFWLRFKGGKGIATSAGVLVALVPYSLLIILAVWLLVMAVSRYVSLASVCASLALPFATWLTGRSVTLIVVTAAMAALAIWKHRANLKRLAAGTEHRFGKPREPEPPGQTV